MQKFNELYESIVKEYCCGVYEDMDKVEELINYAGFDRAEVQVLKDSIRLVHKNKRKLDALRMEVIAELAKNGIEAKADKRKTDGENYVFNLTLK